MEESISEFILTEEEFSKKIEHMFHLKRKINIVFDNSIIFKTLIVKLFIEVMNLDVDENLLVSAMLLCQCKKVNNAQDITRIETYAKESADYLENLGFNKDFCILCEQHNRYSNSYPRKKESDILELADQFGGMLLDRPERVAFPIEEALILLESRNLKGCNNVYLEDFKKFINIVKEVNA